MRKLKWYFKEYFWAFYSGIILGHYIPHNTIKFWIICLILILSVFMSKWNTYTTYVRGETSAKGS